MVHLHADVSVLLHQLVAVGCRGRSKERQTLCLALGIAVSFGCLFLADHVEDIFSHSAVGGPLAAHQAVESAPAALNDVIAGNLLGLAGGVICHQRSYTAPSRPFAAEKITGGQLAHQIVDNIVDELALPV